MKIASIQRSLDGSAKYLLSLTDGRRIEAVDLRSGSRRTICVSSQVGCVLDCSFCATGRMGFSRNLSTDEIVGQVATLVSASGEPVTPVSNVVFMGMGEPFYNYANVIAAAKRLSDPRGFGIAPSKVTISTAGVLPAIKSFLDEGHAFRLAISITSAIPEVRSSLMPINERYSLSELRGVLLALPRSRQRNIMLEVPLLSGINDGERDATALREFCQGLAVRINLIAWNPTQFRANESELEAGGSVDQTGDQQNSGSLQSLLPAAAQSRQPARPDDQTVLRFQAILRQDPRPVFIRKSLGRDVAAACGQLALR